MTPLGHLHVRPIIAACSSDPIFGASRALFFLPKLLPSRRQQRGCLLFKPCAAFSELRAPLLLVFRHGSVKRRVVLTCAGRSCTSRAFARVMSRVSEQ